MLYHAQSKQFTTSAAALDRASHELINAIRHIRRASGLDARGYSHEGLMESPQFAEQAIITGAAELGIDLGATQFGVLDVSS